MGYMFLPLWTGQTDIRSWSEPLKDKNLLTGSYSIEKAILKYMFWPLSTGEIEGKMDKLCSKMFILLKLFSKIPLFLKFDFIKIELCVKNYIWSGTPH